MVCLFVWRLGGTIGSFHRTGLVSGVKCLLTLPPLPPQSMLKHTAAVAAAAAAALDLSGRRISRRINSVFVVTSASAARAGAFLFSTGAVEGRRGRNGGKMSAACRRRRYSGRARWRAVIGWKEETFVRFFIVRLNGCGSRELKSLLQARRAEASRALAAEPRQFRRGQRRRKEVPSSLPAGLRRG